MAHVHMRQLLLVARDCAQTITYCLAVLILHAAHVTRTAARVRLVHLLKRGSV